MIKNIFVSMPMKDIKEEVIFEQMDNIVNDLRESGLVEDYYWINSVLPNHKILTRDECLIESLKLMSKADIIVMAKGWEEASGCRIEYTFALETNKIIIFEEEQINDEEVPLEEFNLKLFSNFYNHQITMLEKKVDSQREYIQILEHKISGAFCSDFDNEGFEVE